MSGYQTGTINPLFPRESLQSLFPGKSIDGSEPQTVELLPVHVWMILK